MHTLEDDGVDVGVNEPHVCTSTWLNYKNNVEWGRSETQNELHGPTYVNHIFYVNVKEYTQKRTQKVKDIEHSRTAVGDETGEW